MRKLTDESPMPFGKHKGKDMDEVPAGYLLWLYDELQGDSKPVAKALMDYIEDNRDVLEKEVKEHRR